jgi:hypothetical protein
VYVCMCERVCVCVSGLRTHTKTHMTEPTSTVNNTALLAGLIWIPHNAGVLSSDAISPYVNPRRLSAATLLVSRS